MKPTLEEYVNHLNEENISIYKRMETLELRIGEYHDALDFYANCNRWTLRADGGKTARQALNEVTEHV